MSKQNIFIEPAPLDLEEADEFGFPTKNNKVFPMPPSPPIEADPPSYESAVAQEREHRRLIGALLLKTSHFFGMQPFSAKVSCQDDVCRRLRFRDRICVPDLILCVVNLLVIFNHLQLRLRKCYQQEESFIYSTKTLETVLHVIDSALPFVCVIGMMCCSYHMHHLLQCLTDTHKSIFPDRCAKVVQFWRYVLYVINGFFVLGTVMELPQNFLIELRPPRVIFLNRSQIPDILDINETPLSQLPSFWDQLIIFVDRYYFPIINFGVVKVPQLFIMMIAIRVAVMFQASTCTLRSTAHFSRQMLENYFSQLMNIINVLNLLEMCFCQLILAIVSTSVVKIIFTSYGTLKEVMDGEAYGRVRSMMIDMQSQPGPEGGNWWLSLLIMLDSTCSVVGLVLNVFWIIVFIAPCIVCNEISRSALPVITSKLVSDDAKFVKDQIVQKLMDPSWGLTLGRFIKVDRGFAMTLTSLIFTIVVVWLQLTIPTLTTN